MCTRRVCHVLCVRADGDQCVPNPCLHGGNCTDMVGGFNCSCSAPHGGPICEMGALPGDRDVPPTAPQIIVPSKTKRRNNTNVTFHFFGSLLLSGFWWFLEYCRKRHRNCSMSDGGSGSMRPAVLGVWSHVRVFLCVGVQTAERRPALRTRRFWQT